MNAGFPTHVEFAGPGSGTAPLTWGQRAIWEAIERTAPDDHYFNFGRLLKVPGGRTAGEIVEALAALIERHGALRTRLGEPGRSGAEPYQRLEEKGRLPVTVAVGDPDRVLGELAARRFDYADEWPMRVALVLDGDRVTHVVLVFCHLAADGLGAEAAVRDLRMLLLRGGRGGDRLRWPDASQPIDLARWQAGPEGRKAARAAAAYWESEYRRIPPTMFSAPRDARAAARPPIWRALLHSPALESAVRSIAHTHAASTSTVLLTAVAALVGRFTGHETCAMLPIAANRFRRDTANIVATMSQEGLFTLDLGGGGASSFTDLLRSAGPAALRAYRSAYHDPADRNRITALVGSERGMPIHPYCCFNDMRFADPGPAACDPGEITAALARTSVSWPMSQDKLNCRFCVHLTTEGVSLTADTRYLPRPDSERFLLELESLLVETAVR